MAAANRESIDSMMAALRECVERGKAAQHSPFPADLMGRPGAVEWTAALLAEGVPAQTIVDQALVPALLAVGRRFQCNEAFIPDLLVAAEAVKRSMALLRARIVREPVEPRGTLIIGTVAGDVHDIGKNLVAMMVEGAGWRVVDLGVDVAPERFDAALAEHPGAVVGLSALLTTTMQAMGPTIAQVRARYPDAAVVVGGAPVTDAFARSIDATGYAPDPQSAVDLLESLRAA